MLSLFHPAANDAVDWQRGNYSLTTRGGRVESESGWGQMKKNTRMVAEGSVLVSAAAAARRRRRRRARWLSRIPSIAPASRCRCQSRLKVPA